jgi:LPXTG-motif cell wall-anchored protein
MYQHALGAITPAAAVGATLPVTGFNPLWYLMAGFTLIASGFAISRMAPRKARATK